MRDFKTLDIWKRGISLSKMIYVLSREFPAEEKFGLQSQIRRAATSIPINKQKVVGVIVLKILHTSSILQKALQVNWNVN